MDGTNRFLVKEDSLFEALAKLARERLTKKQKQILGFLSENGNLTSTALVRTLSKEMKCSRSAVWNNLNSLKHSGLVENEPHRPLKLTAIAGKILREVLT